MPPCVVICGRGKLATALESQLADAFDVVKLSRPKFDARQPEQIRAHLHTYRPDYVFNTVVSGGLDACAQYPAEALLVNTLFPLHLAKLSADMGFTLIQFSTDSVFNDAQQSGLCVESTPASPPNMYGYTKFGADSLIPVWTTTYLIYRLPVMFGPCPTHSQFLEHMIARLRSGSPVSVAADVFSYPVYSMDVAHTVKSHLKEKPVSGLYHLAGTEKASLYELVEATATLLQFPNELKRARGADFTERDYKPRSIHLASEKLPPLRSWRTSVRDYCRAIEPFC